MSGGKFFPEVGTPLYLQQKPSDNYYCSMVKRPYTVIDVKPSEITIQSARLVYPPGPVYYDTLPIDIVPDPNGRIEKLHWAPKAGYWQENSVYPKYAHFGSYDYFPYLD